MHLTLTLLMSWKEWAYLLLKMFVSRMALRIRAKNSEHLGDFQFLFYYAHHLTTIEGGRCGNDKNIYQQLRMLRSHGMVREASDTELINKYQNKYPELNPDFIFAFQHII